MTNPPPPPGQNHPDNTPLDKTPRWTKPPRGQNPPGKPLPGQNPPDKTPRTKPPGQTPRTKHPGQKLHPLKNPYKTPQIQTTTAKSPRISPRSPTKHPEDKNLAKSKMAFILNSDGFRALLLI